jgi:hypothetical protein
MRHGHDIPLGLQRPRIGGLDIFVPDASNEGDTRRRLTFGQRALE